MFWGFIAMIAAGFGGAGLAVILNKITRGRTPKWLTPAAAAVAMLVTAITNEYSWFAQSVANLKPGVVVVNTMETSAFYRPWTYVYPMTEGFVALDTNTLADHPSGTGRVTGDLYLFGRWENTQHLQVLFDCPTGKTMPMIPGENYDTVTTGDFPDAGGDSQMVTAACQAQEGK